MQAMMRANVGHAMPYGEDRLTQEVIIRFQELFEYETRVIFLPTGSSANSLALATLTPPYGIIYCHKDSHVNVDECGAPEFFTGGAKLIAISGKNGKIAPKDLENNIIGFDVVHHMQPAVVSITQVTEAGTVYTIEEIQAISRICHKHNLKLHMDGARFANALVSLNCTPAEMTWKSGCLLYTSPSPRDRG